jgi:toxin ParE1/3/4
MLPVVILPAARLDLLEQAEYYDSEGGEDLGNRFIANCEAGFARLAVFPESGTRVRLKHPELKDCRFILAPGFEKILIFYKLSDNKVQVVRVLHGARDIESVPDEGGKDDTQH